MRRGTLRLSTGLGARCDYELGGTSNVPSALYLPLRESDVGTLNINGEERQVHISFGPEPGEASFVFA
jgi:hypothetical protein